MSISELLPEDNNFLGKSEALLESSSSDWVLCSGKFGLEGSDSLSNWFWSSGTSLSASFLQSFPGFNKSSSDGFLL